MASATGAIVAAGSPHALAAARGPLVARDPILILLFVAAEAHIAAREAAAAVARPPRGRVCAHAHAAPEKIIEGDTRAGRGRPTRARRNR